MIIECKNCSKKFVVKNSDIPEEGRNVQCGNCSFTWLQQPSSFSNETIKQTKIKEPIQKVDNSLSVDSIKASDGKTYKFLGSQWAELLPSGKTGLFAKKKIGKELDKLTGRKEKTTVQKRQKKVKKELDPSTDISLDEKKLPDIYKPKQGLGFIGYILLIIIVSFSIVGVLKTFEGDLINRFPESEYIFELLNEQLVYISESVKNMIVIITDLINSY